MEWEELLAKPNLTPGELLHLVEKKDGVWVPSSEVRRIRQMDLAKLHGHPVFNLLTLEETRLGAILPTIELAYLKEEEQATLNKILALVAPTVRERCLPLLEDIMSHGSRLHPLLHALWGARSRWPYFQVIGRDNPVPTHQWKNLFFGGTRDRSELEVMAFRTLVALQYDKVDSFTYISCIGAWSRTFFADVSYRENFPDTSIESLRSWLTVRQHLLAHVEQGSRLDPAVLLGWP